MKPSKPKRSGWRYWLKLLLAGVVWGILLLQIVRAYVMTRPVKGSICCSTPADWNFEYEDIILNVHDGTNLSGWYIPSQNGAAVILLHGYCSNRLSMMHHARILAENGYGVLLYDQRGCGESEGDRLSWGWLDVKDVPFAVTYVQNKEDVEPGRIGILGVSKGAEIALGAAAQLEGLAAVVADGPSCPTIEDLPPIRSDYIKGRLARSSDWLLLKFIELWTWTSAPSPLIDRIPEISPRPIMLISTGRGSERLQAQHYYDHARDPKILWNVPEALHGGGLPARPEEYGNRITAFFDQSLREGNNTD